MIRSDYLGGCIRKRLTFGMKVFFPVSIKNLLFSVFYDLVDPKNKITRKDMTLEILGILSDLVFEKFDTNFMVETQTATPELAILASIDQNLRLQEFAAFSRSLNLPIVIKYIMSTFVRNDLGLQARKNEVCKLSTFNVAKIIKLAGYLSQGDLIGNTGHINYLKQTSSYFKRTYGYDRFDLSPVEKNSFAYYFFLGVFTVPHPRSPDRAVARRNFDCIFGGNPKLDLVGLIEEFILQTGINFLNNGTVGCLDSHFFEGFGSVIGQNFASIKFKENSSRDFVKNFLDVVNRPDFRNLDFKGYNEFFLAGFDTENPEFLKVAKSYVLLVWDSYYHTNKKFPNILVSKVLDLARHLGQVYAQNSDSWANPKRNFFFKIITTLLYGIVDTSL